MTRNKNERKPRVAIFNASTMDFVQQPLDLAETLRQDGYQVDVVAPTLFNLRQYYQQQGINFIYIHLWRKNTTFLRGWEFVLKCLFLSFRHYDITVGVDDLGVLVAYIFKRLGLAGKSVYYALEITTAISRHSLRSLLIRHCIQHVDAVINTGKERLQFLNKRLNINKPSFVVAPVAMYNYYSPTGRLRQLLGGQGISNKKIVIYCGQVSSSAGVEPLINSVSYWFVDAILVILGYSIEKTSPQLINDTLDKTGTKNRVFVFMDTFVGVLRLDLLKIIADADLGVAFYDAQRDDPNLLYITPNKLYNYVACSLPVVVSDNISLRFVEEEGWGLCVDYHNPKMIASAINRILGDQQLYFNMKQQAGRLFKQRHNYQIQIGPFLQWLRESNL